MKSLKLLFLVVLLVFGLSSASSAACARYSIKCDGGSFYVEVCGNSASEMIGKVWRIADVLC